ncbi:hypothetical protein E8E13_011366 [Curvularia kusanoi]|uniref:Uncharacterized protein n=1 Tax=Curvularia kusanoi TaxID=90978 RepID=A0A9P4TQE1_CURKU|nr:hypothetical protein E8E13_011366 [Curvularia kusanoi]
MCPNSVLRAKGFTPQLPPRDNIEKADEEEDPSLTNSQLLIEGKALLVAEMERFEDENNGTGTVA